MSCHAVSAGCWAIVFCRAGHSQTPLPEPGTTAICWALMRLLLVQLHPWMPGCCLLQSCCCLGYVRSRKWVEWWWCVCRGIQVYQSSTAYGPKVNSWKLQILPPAVIYPHHIHRIQSLVTNTMPTWGLSLPWPHWTCLSVWPSLPLEWILPWEVSSSFIQIDIWQV